MESWLPVLVVVGVIAFVVLAVRSWTAERDFAAELARTPELHFTAAGLSKDREVRRHASFPSGPWRRHLVRQRLAQGAMRVRRHEAEERRHRR